MSFLKISKLFVILNVISYGYSSNDNSINNNINFDNVRNINCNNTQQQYDTDNNNGNNYNNTISNSIEHSSDRQLQLYEKVFFPEYNAISKQKLIQTILNYDKEYKTFMNEISHLFDGFKNITLDINNYIFCFHKTRKTNEICKNSRKIRSALRDMVLVDIKIPSDYVKKIAEIFDSFYYTKNSYINEINEYIEIQNTTQLHLHMRDVLNYIAKCSNELYFNVTKNINELIKNNNLFLKVEKLLNDINNNNEDLKKNNINLEKIYTIFKKIKEDNTVYSSEKLYNIEKQLKLSEDNNPSNISTKLLYDGITKQIIYLQESTKYKLPLYEEAFNIVNATIKILREVCDALFKLFSDINENKEKILHDKLHQKRWNRYIVPNVENLKKRRKEHLDKEFYNVFQYSNEQIFKNDFNKFSKIHEKIIEMFVNISNTDKANIINNGICTKECNTKSIRKLINIGSENQTSNIYGIDKYGNNYLNVLNTFIGLLEENHTLSNLTAKDFINEKVVPLLNTFKNLIENNISYIFKKKHMIKFDKTIGLYIDFAKNLTVIIDKIAKCNVCKDIKTIIDEYITNRNK